MKSDTKLGLCWKSAHQSMLGSLNIFETARIVQVACQKIHKTPILRLRFKSESDPSTRHRSKDLAAYQTWIPKLLPNGHEQCCIFHQLCLSRHHTNVKHLIDCGDTKMLGGWQRRREVCVWGGGCEVCSKKQVNVPKHSDPRARPYLAPQQDLRSSRDGRRYSRQSPKYW